MIDDAETYQPLARVDSDNKSSWDDIQPHLPYEYESGEKQPGRSS